MRSDICADAFHVAFKRHGWLPLKAESVLKVPTHDRSVSSYLPEFWPIISYAANYIAVDVAPYVLTSVLGIVAPDIVSAVLLVP
jgi:hypothetical protein